MGKPLSFYEPGMNQSNTWIVKTISMNSTSAPPLILHLELIALKLLQ